MCMCISKQNVHVIDASALLAYVYLYMSVLPLWRSSEKKYLLLVTCYLSHLTD